MSCSVLVQASLSHHSPSPGSFIEEEGITTPAAVLYLCLSPSALLDSSAGQGSGGHKTREESREDVADPKGNEFLRERLDDSNATNIGFASPSPNV